MFYQYKKRMGELHRITKIQDQTEKGKALNQFIKMELEILASLEGRPCRSQALDSARCLLYTLQHQNKGYVPDNLSI